MTYQSSKIATINHPLNKSHPPKTDLLLLSPTVPFPFSCQSAPKCQCQIVLLHRSISSTVASLFFSVPSGGLFLGANTNQTEAGFHNLSRLRLRGAEVIKNLFSSNRPDSPSGAEPVNYEFLPKSDITLAPVWAAVGAMI